MGRTLLDLLDDRSRAHGVHLTGQVSVRVTDLALIAEAMRRLRSSPRRVRRRGGRSCDDLLEGGDGLPPTDGLRYSLEDGGRVVVRPSGTEPKLKAYLEVVVAVTGELSEAAAEAERRLEALRAAVRAAVASASRRLTGQPPATDASSLAWGRRGVTGWRHVC
jgi:phosphomannomutase